MINIKSFELFESASSAKKMKPNSLLLVTGKKDAHGLSRLFAFPTKYTFAIDPKKDDGHMVTLGDMCFIINNNNGMLSKQQMSMVKRNIFMDNLGFNASQNLNGPNFCVALNSDTNKTPLHWLSGQYSDVDKMLRELTHEILKLPNIKWEGI